MDATLKRALEQDLVIDITTIGRKSGEPRRIEMWFHYVDGRFFITGTPGPRDWYANMCTNPNFTFHLKESVQADLPARAIPILDQDERRSILSSIFIKLDRTIGLEKWVANSPLVEVMLDT
ncbi:nitroreductase family deazaflavin-dependent oxidoreductase [Chloroflexi bacterium TSY]|nr:nitroreductase family deazaflavin-dependent oxidoreductase [Chloroflexi bacterium TSY]